MPGDDEMQHRTNDMDSLPINRTIPLWGIIMLALGLLGQGVLLWSGSRESAIEMKYLALQVAKSTERIDVLATQISQKDTKDNAQDSAIADLQRRVLRNENMLERSKP